MKLKRILMGDDSQEYLDSLSRFLSRYAEVDCVTTPDEVIARARDGHYDIIITDLHYFDITGKRAEGFNVLEALREVQSRKILHTASRGDDIKSRARELGAEYLPKPADLMQLKELVSGA